MTIDLDKLPTASERQRVSAYLHGLPDVEPPAALQQRVLSAASAPHSRVPRAAAWAGVMVAAGLSAVALFAVRDDRVIAPEVTPSAYANAPAQAQLRAIDRELQMALQRGAEQGHVAVLWAEREAVVAQLDSPTPAAPVRM
ncbi:MAG: hypothetical protein Q8L45_16320 [Xanthomonadaceae bacterium]|nr:hypothetical protein [Xanthomonadaceae bacterium]MDP2186728.1 hypothetical protein [Xanthomonadales bacterium]MDZ4117544.1 hypothetical protein [Xanthomonadaceae bacterium]MDZ4377883.1 hypothetical protein [Xanthomonadaceae bacterium]